MILDGKDNGSVSGVAIAELADGSDDVFESNWSGNGETVLHDGFLASVLKLVEKYMNINFKAAVTSY